MKTIGLIVNPIAGMGGSVGLKGTDGEMIAQARRLGAQPVTPQRAATFLAKISHQSDIAWLAPPGKMGADFLTALSLPFTLIDGSPDPEGETSANDTRRAAIAMVQAGADLLVFVGGDGTARDIHDAIGVEKPVVAVPAGVKVFSSVFALSARAAAAMVDAFVEGTDLTEVEVLDIDEDAFRANRLAAQHYGFLLTPNVQSRLQPGKEGSRMTPDEADNKRDVAEAIVEQMESGELYLLGPGTTVQAIAEALGIAKTLLGIDAVLDGKVIAQDLNEQQILALLDEHPHSTIVVTPLGGNGFIFGRGNKPFTPAVIRRVGPDRITIIATERKALQIGVLRVDTGDTALDATLAGYRQVIIGYDLARAMKVQAT